MKEHKSELNVDFIGSQRETLTKAEEQAISKYLKASKTNRKKILDKRRNRLTKNQPKTSIK